MRVAIKVLLVATIAAVIPAPGSLVGTLHVSDAYALAATAANLNLRPKDQSRIESDDTGLSQDKWRAQIELAQAFGPPPFYPPMRDGGEFMSPKPGPGPMAFGPPLPRSAARPSPRRGCEEDIHRQAALAGYLKSKLRLQGNQQEAWQKLEEAARPAVESMLVLCAQLPDHMVERPAMPEMIEMAEKQLSARAAFFRAIREPARALFQLLSPDQRAAFGPPTFEPPLPPGRF